MAGLAKQVREFYSAVPQSPCNYWSDFTHYIPYFSDYKSRFFSCHGGRSTYTPVWPICRQIHQHAS